MPCPEFEDEILEYQEAALHSSQRGRVEAHLLSCPDCRAFLQQQRALDGAFSRQLRRPSLSPDFGARLSQRIEREALSTERLRERKRQLQAEYETGLTRLGRQPFMLAGWLDRFGYVLLGLVLLLILLQLLPSYSHSLEFRGSSRQGQAGLLPLAVGGLALLFGILVAFPRAFRRLGSAIV
jgi:anti-sigma factor RsiW